MHQSSSSQPVGHHPLLGSPDDLLGVGWDLQKFLNGMCRYGVPANVLICEMHHLAR